MYQVTDGAPMPGIMFGLTHNVDGTVRMREPKILKVGIGMSKGKAINVWRHTEEEWRIRVGWKEGQAVTHTVKGGPREAEKAYRTLLPKAPECNFPRKQPFFNFTREVFQEDGSVLFEPDFDATYAQPPMPKEIDIVFLSNQPWGDNNGYQMWSRQKCLCRGDGINASRVVELAKPEDQGLIKPGAKFFPIMGACYATGQCEYARPTTDARGKEAPAACKPSADLKFQLAKSLRIGGTAYFHTSARKSIENIHTSLEAAKALTGGRLAGLTFKMIVKPYFVNHNGQASKQFGVSIEFRAADLADVEKNMLAQAWRFSNPFGESSNKRSIPALASKPIPALVETNPVEPEEVTGEDDDDPPYSAAAIADEFYPEQSSDGEEGYEETDPPSVMDAPEPPAAEATRKRTEEVREKLAKAKKEQPVAAPTPTGYREGFPVYAEMPPLNAGMSDRQKFFVGENRYYYDSFDNAYRPAPDTAINKPDDKF